jgi:hypothetical protein
MHCNEDLERNDCNLNAQSRPPAPTADLILGGVRLLSHYLGLISKTAVL